MKSKCCQAEVEKINSFEDVVYICGKCHLYCGIYQPKQKIVELQYIDLNNVSDYQDVFNVMREEINELVREVNRLKGGEE